MLLLGLAPWDNHLRLFWYHQGLLSLRGLQKGVLEPALPGQCHCKLLPTTTVPMLLAIASAIKPSIWTKHWGQLALTSSDSISVRSNIISVVLCIVWRRRREWAGTDG